MTAMPWPRRTFHRLKSIRGGLYDKTRSLLGTRHVRRMRVNGVALRIVDFSSSLTPRLVARELMDDDYGLEGVSFSPGDVVIDVGANVGVVSLYLAKRYPGIVVHSFEPIPENYRHLVTNISLNGVRNVVPHNLAVTRDGRDLRMAVHYGSASGGATAFARDAAQAEGHSHYTVGSTTLDRIFAEHVPKRCRLLKIDCEGAEHEILTTAAQCLDRVDFLSGEFHINSQLREAGYDMDRLVELCKSKIGADRVFVGLIHMAE